MKEDDMSEEITEDPPAGEIAALMAMSEDTIDTTDIPRSARGELARRQAHLSTDARVVDYAAP
jgi:hypothetical protein